MPAWGFVSDVALAERMPAGARTTTTRGHALCLHGPDYPAIT